MRTRLSADEYLAWEREQQRKHEYFHGEVFAIAGGSPRHNVLAANLVTELRSALRSKGCNVFTSDQRVACPPGERYIYPDVTVVCGPAQFQANAKDVLLNPTVVVEVLSRSTEEYDRGLKWQGYRSLESLTDYVLVSQGAVLVEHYQKNADGSWTYRSHESGGRVVLADATDLHVDNVYAGAFELPGDDAA